MQARDELRNRRLCGGDVFEARLRGPDSIEGTVDDNNDGTYTVNYTATLAGQYQLCITTGALQHHHASTISSRAINFHPCDSFLSAGLKRIVGRMDYNVEVTK